MSQGGSHGTGDDQETGDQPGQAALTPCPCPRPASLVVADFGCGDCTLAASVKNQVHCFDLVPLSPRVTVCDMAKVLGAPPGRERVLLGRLRGEVGAPWSRGSPAVGAARTCLLESWMCAWGTAEPTSLGGPGALPSPINIAILLLLLPGVCRAASRPSHHPPSPGVSRDGQVPLAAESVDVAVFCLELMGTNLQEILGEANRVLKLG